MFVVFLCFCVGTVRLELAGELDESPGGLDIGGSCYLLAFAY